MYCFKRPRNRDLDNLLHKLLRRRFDGVKEIDES